MMGWMRGGNVVRESAFRSASRCGMNQLIQPEASIARSGPGGCKVLKEAVRVSMWWVGESK